MADTDVATYKQETTTSNSFLDPHHTHFILVNDENEGSEINFRSKFESRELYSGCTHADLIRSIMETCGGTQGPGRPSSVEERVLF